VPVVPDEDAVVAGENVDDGIAVGVAEDEYMQEPVPKTNRQHPKN